MLKKKKKTPQRNIGRDLHISPSTVHDIQKDSKSLEEFQQVKGKGAHLSWTTPDIWVLRQHCINIINQ